MNTLFLQAKYHWEHGDPAHGFALLDHELTRSLGESPFFRPDHLLTGSRSSFESAVAILLTGRRLLSAERLLRLPLCQVLVALWRLAPLQEWIDVLLRYDFLEEPEEGPSDFEPFGPPANSPEARRLLAIELAASARAGVLSSDGAEQPLGGRPVLPLTALAEVEPQRWGELQPLLLAELTLAYREAPTASGSWAARLEADPTEVGVTALYDLFGRHGAPPLAALTRWRLVQERFPAYAEAARASLERLADQDVVATTELVRLATGRSGIEDGSRWLRAWLNALQTGELAEVR